MKKHWWKVLAAVLVLYSIVAGMLIPLRMGVISQKTEMQLKAGESNTLKVKFYNARFSKESAGAIQARIRLDTALAACATAVRVIDERNLELDFQLGALNPNEIPNPFPMLELSSPENGYTFSSVFIRKGSDSLSEMTTATCEVEPYATSKKTSFPFLNILEESMRNLFYHVPMWFGMMLIFLVSVIYSIRQLQKGKGLRNDIYAKSFAGVGVLYGILGLVTGAIWAKHTWGAYWSWDVKQNTSAVALLIYLAYFVLRSSLDDADKRARIAAAYNIFAFATLIPLLYIVPRMVDSLHPGAEGNPAFSSYDLDNTLRLVFYPSVIGWILMGVWIATVWLRIELLRSKILEEE